jgi:diguanylate cyclase (GGDEF)-like protein
MQSPGTVLALSSSQTQFEVARSAMVPIVKSWVNFLVPGGIVFLIALWFLRPQGLPQWVQGPVHAFPIVVLGFGFFFGWYLSSSRLILSLMVLTFADRALVLFPQTDADPASPGRIVFTAAAVLVPLNLMALSLIKEETLSTRRGVLRLVVILIQPLLVLWVSLPEQAGIAQSLDQSLVSMPGLEWTGLPQAALLAFGGGLVLIGVRFMVEKKPLDGGVFWALIASFTAFQGIAYGWSATNFLSAAGLILFLTLIQAAHQQVYRDELTGAFGKVAYEEAVASLGKKYAIAVIGIDQLKQYGNQHGKSVSDQLLRLIAPKIVAVAGARKVYRLAGEEFTILFPRRTATETVAELDAIRKAVEETVLRLRGRDQVWEGRGASRPRSEDGILPVTVSIGLAEIDDAQLPIGLVTKAAYRALYEAKGEGGNFVKRGVLIDNTKKSAQRETGRIVAHSEFENS